MDFGSLCGFWVPVEILGLYVNFGSLRRFWVSVRILGRCLDLGFVFVRGNARWVAWIFSASLFTF